MSHFFFAAKAIADRHFWQNKSVQNRLHRRILTMNRGSSTLKSALYEVGDRNKLVVSITVDHAGLADSRLTIADPNGNNLWSSVLPDGETNASLEAMSAWLGENGFLSGLSAVGHRLVQGGPLHKAPQRITPQFVSAIEELSSLDPDHTPAAIRGIKFITARFPDLPQVACFDTAFHSSLPIIAKMYALPRRLYDEGVLRYGFHGLSYEYVMGELRALEGKAADGRVIIAHLGGGASVVAVRGGKSIDTSMGFTPLEGLVMATRAGDVDPGVLLYLLDHQTMSAKEISQMLNKQSGLLGVSETSADMKVLLDNINRDQRAQEAVDLFCYRAKKYLGAYCAALGGLDLLVFTGGIGEHAAVVRQRICDGLDFIGIRLDASCNESNAPVISASDSRVKVRVVKTNEDLSIVRHVRSVLDWNDAERSA
jgi:acetate kinase